MASEQIVRRLLNEGDFSFSTRLRSTQRGEVYVESGPEWLEASADVHIKWTLELDLREWGVKAFDVSIQQVTMYLRLVDENDQEREEVITTPEAAPAPPPEGDVRAEFMHYSRPDDFKIKVVYTQSDSADYLPPLVPRSVEIYLQKRIIEISF